MQEALPGRMTSGLMLDKTRIIRDLINRTEKTRLQNILMRIPDKVCATALSSLTESERAPLYALIAGSKAERIREEIRLGSRRRMTPAVRSRLIHSFVSYFAPGATRGPGIWLRPIRPEKE